MTPLTEEEKMMLRASLQTYIVGQQSQANGVQSHEWVKREKELLDTILEKIDPKLSQLTLLP